MENRASSANPSDAKHDIYDPDEENDVYEDDEEHDVYDDDEGNEFCDYDIAITHHRNTELKEQLNQFLQDAQKHNSLRDPQTRSWLVDLPFSMRKDVIPLFTHGDTSGDASEDYQLHPGRTWLDVDTAAAQPHKELFCLMKDDETLPAPITVIGIGRLFINTSADTGKRTSKWTGYEVFVDQELALWIVFDRKSHYPPAADWYPVPIRLGHDDEPQVGPFDIARLLPSLHDLANASFKGARDTVQQTMDSGKMKLGLIAQKDVERLLSQTILDSQVVETSDTLQQLPLSDPPAMDSPELHANYDALSHELLIAVRDGAKTAQKILDFLAKNKDDFSRIKELITPGIVAGAAGNEGCGEQILKIIIKQFKDEVRKSIGIGVVRAAAENGRYGDQIIEILIRQFNSEIRKSISFQVVKAAAGNPKQGAQVLQRLLDLEQDTVIANTSDIAICNAATNYASGAQILQLFYKADEEKFNTLILKVFCEAMNPRSYQSEAAPHLKTKLEEIKYPYYSVLMSGGPMQLSPSSQLGKPQEVR